LGNKIFGVKIKYLAKSIPFLKITESLYQKRSSNTQSRGYSTLSNKCAAQIIGFTFKECSLHSLITSCTNYCFFEKMQPALLLHPAQINLILKFVNLQRMDLYFLLITGSCIKLEYRNAFSRSN